MFLFYLLIFSLSLSHCRSLSSLTQSNHQIEIFMCVFVHVHAYSHTGRKKKQQLTNTHVHTLQNADRVVLRFSGKVAADGSSGNIKLGSSNIVHYT